jgi:hypothetical protein
MLKELIAQFNAGLLTSLEVIHKVDMMNMGSDTCTYSFRVIQGTGFGYINGDLVK